MKSSILYNTITGIHKRFKTTMPGLVKLACTSADFDVFRAKLKELTECSNSDSTPSSMEAAVHIRTLIEWEDRDIFELSQGKPMGLHTLRTLYEFLKSGKSRSEVQLDFYIELYVLFAQLYGLYTPSCEPIPRLNLRRWPSGLRPDVIENRKRNKERIVELLVGKIDARHSKTTRYKFEPGLTYDQKVQLIRYWWQDYRFHLACAIKNPGELNAFLNHSLSADTMRVLQKARWKGIPFFITPYYLSLLNVEEEGFDDQAIRSYVLYSEQLVKTYGTIRAWEREDEVVSGEPNAAGWMLPDGHNIHRRYPDVAIMIPDSMGRACGGLCAVCQRMYDFQSERLNFDFQNLKPKESWDKKLARLMQYFEQDTQLRDILITGGDALMSQNATLRKILDAVYGMAQRKRMANLSRPDGEKYAELQRVRLGTRLLAYLPMRVNAELVDILREFREKAAAIGVKQFFIQTHFQSPLEVTPEARKAIAAILSAGWVITNQHVYTAAVSRRGHNAKLRRILNQVGVVGYYTFSVKGFGENQDLFTPACRSMQEAAEEKAAGILPAEKLDELLTGLQTKGYNETKMEEFLQANKIPFVATDRNVLNLPGIGKSMTFQWVGLTPEGKRILMFDHDHGRRHSPIIDGMGRIFIEENKSVAAYLRQLHEMGENLAEYISIWRYRSGETEPRYRLFEYPGYDFTPTDAFTNLKLGE